MLVLVPIPQLRRDVKYEMNSGLYIVTLNNDSPPTQTVSHTWDDGPGVCLPVSVDQSSWGKVKSNYR